MLISDHRKKIFFHLAVSFFLFSSFFFSLHAQDALLIIKAHTTTKDTKSGLAGNLGVRTANVSEESLEGVDIEVKKDGNTITKVASAKKGKCSFQIPVSISDPKNDYIIYISKEGYVPKVISVNAYVPKEEFKQYSFVRYDFEIDPISMLATTMKDIVIEKASARIKWDDVKEHKFVFDQTYAKVVQKDEQKLAANPDLYLKNLAKKKKKEEEDAEKKRLADEAKKKADEEARIKADEEAKRLAEQKAKEENERILQANMEAMKKELEKKRIADSLAEAARRKKEFEMANANANVKVEVKKTTLPVEEPAVVKEITYDAEATYSINLAMKTHKLYQEKINKEKANNLFMKYETNNTLTSLLNVVDEQDKKLKKQ